MFVVDSRALVTVKRKRGEMQQSHDDDHDDHVASQRADADGMSDENDDSMAVASPKAKRPRNVSSTKPSGKDTVDHHALSYH